MAQKKQKIGKKVKLNEVNEIEETQNFPVDSLPRNKAIHLDLLCSPYIDKDYLPTSFQLEYVGKNFVKVSSQDDWINDVVYLCQDIEYSPLLQMESNSRLLRSSIKAIKKYTEGKYQIFVCDGKHYFSYSFTLSGATVGDVMNKVVKMYEEIAAENSYTYDELRNELVKG